MKDIRVVYNYRKHKYYIQHVSRHFICKLSGTSAKKTCSTTQKYMKSKCLLKVVAKMAI